MREKRTQRRLSVEIPIQVMSPESDQLIPVQEQDISWGGTTFISADSSIREGSRLQFIFPWVNGKSFTAEAQVVRQEILKDGRRHFAARFTCLSQRSEHRLEKLLDMLSERDLEAMAECSVPTVECLELIFDDKDEMHEQFAQIADGRLSVTVFGAYELDQSILLVIGSTKDFPGLHLRARVNAQMVQRSPSCEWTNLVRLDLRFEHPPEELEHFVSLL